MSRFQSSPLPNIHAASGGVSKEDRKGTTELSRFIQTNLEDAMDRRARHALNWAKVIAVLNGVHWYNVVGNTVMPIRHKPGDRTIRAKVPIMRPWYQWQLGRLNDLQVGVTATPRVGVHSDSFLRADRAQAVMDSWIDEFGIDVFHDQQNQFNLVYGTVGWQRYVDVFNQQVKIRPLPGSELYPIPYDARSIEEADGLIHRTFKSISWLEKQDDMTRQWRSERGLSPEPEKRMADFADKRTFALNSRSEHIGVGGLTGDRNDGAMVTTVWLKPREGFENGEYIFLVEEQVFRYWSRPEPGITDPFTGVITDEQRQQQQEAVPRRIPVELVYYTKHPDDFWGVGFCETLAAPQQEADRQFSAILRSSMNNRTVNFYDADALDNKDIMPSEHNWVPFHGVFDGSNRRPVFQVPGVPLNAETGSALGLAVSNAQRAAGFESRIIFGEAEGRVEGGPANSLLNQNALMPLQSVANRIFNAYKRTYPVVLDMIPAVWSFPNRVKATGDANIAREIMLEEASAVPSSRDVILTPTPMLAGGRNAMGQILFQLRQMPDDEGKGSVIRGWEFRRALRMLNLAPPGLDITEKEEQRIHYRIAQLINDGQRPALPPAEVTSLPFAQAMQIEPGTQDGLQVIEDHKRAVELLRDKVLAPEFKFYGQLVQLALTQELQYHQQFTFGAFDHPDNFADDHIQADSRQLEESLNAVENDPFSNDGILTLGGEPVGGNGQIL
ncbi:MAG: hypothetical protein ACYSVY_12975 [Planctomycetota bacterium]|jgi:hypothetical protein